MSHYVVNGDQSFEENRPALYDINGTLILTHFSLVRMNMNFFVLTKYNKVIYLSFYVCVFFLNDFQVI